MITATSWAIPCHEPQYCRQGDFLQQPRRSEAAGKHGACNHDFHILIKCNWSAKE